jgi:hypothetical protein
MSAATITTTTPRRTNRNGLPVRATRGIRRPAHARPVDTAPVEAAPVEAAPVEAAPVEAAPVEAAPVEAAPVETKPKRGKRVPMTEEEKAARVDMLKSTLDAAITGLVTDGNWLTYLRTAQSLGTNWSMNNILLAIAQAEKRGFVPTDMRTFAAWVKLGRAPIKGQKALYINEPVKYRLTPEEAAAKGPKGYGPDGKPLMIFRGKRPSARFDVSQTEGEPLAVEHNPARARLLTGDDPTKAWDAVTANIVAAGYRVTRGMCGGANGFTDPRGREVRVRPDVDAAQATKTLVHEWAHVSLEHVTDFAEYTKHRGRMESEAESVAFIVCGALGLDTTRYSVPYIAGWANGNVDVLAEIAETVTRCARAMLDAVTATEDKGTDVPVLADAA